MRDLLLTVLALIIFPSLCLALALIKTLHRLWWAPNRLQRLMGSQGIKGPPYRFIHGSTKEILSLREEAMSKPVSGLSHQVFPIIQPHIYRWTNLYGKVYLQWNGTMPQLVITEPDLIKEILNNKQRVYPKPNQRPMIKKVFGDGITMSRGQKWAKMRKLANHAFQAENLKGMIPVMIDSVETMLEKWKYHEGKEIDVYEEFKLLSSEVISRTAFGSTYLEGKAIFETLAKLGTVVARTSYQKRIPGMSMLFKTSDQVEAEKLERGIRDSIVEIIKKREETAARGKEDGAGSDFLSVLVKALHDANEEQRISADEIVDECKTFYFAGQDTTSGLLAWTVFLLAIHVDWQEEARNEVIALFGKQNPTSDGISKLKCMSMIINESLRLYPPSTAMMRRAEKDVRLGSLNVPANMTLFIPTLAVHHDPDIWGDDAQLFKPERFSEGVTKATKNNSAAFIPFGTGPRTCVGSNFASVEAKIALAMILQRYSFTLSPAHVHSPVIVMTLRPKYGVRVILNSI